MRKFTIAFLRNAKPRLHSDALPNRVPSPLRSLNSLAIPSPDVAEVPEISIGRKANARNSRKLQAGKIDCCSLHAEISSSTAGKARPTSAKAKRKAKANLAEAKATQNAEAEEPVSPAKFVCEEEKTVQNAAIARSEGIEMIKTEKEIEFNANVSMINANKILMSANESRMIAVIDRSEEIEINENENMINAKKELSELAEKLGLNNFKRGRQWMTTAYKLLDYGISSAHVKKMLTKYRTSAYTNYVDSTLKHLTMLGMSHEEMGRVISRSPTCLNIASETFQSKVEIFESVGIDRRSLGRIMLKAYRTIGWSPSTLRKRTEFWKNYVQGTGENALRTIILKNPSILSLNLQKVTQRIAYLEELGFSKIVLLRNTSILSWTTNALAMRLKLLEQFGMSNTRNFIKCLAALHCMSTLKLYERFHNLLGLGFSYEQAQKMVMSFPHLLHMKEERISLKFSYAVNVMNLSLDMIVAFPPFWGYSYENRIKYRYEVLQDLRTLRGCEMKISLACMLTRTDAKFYRNYVEKLHGYTKHPNL